MWPLADHSTDDPGFFRAARRAPDLLRHAPYVASLPTTSLSPISYSPAELALLNGTPLPSATASLLAAWKAQYDALTAAAAVGPAQGFSLDLFNRAMGLIASRSFPSRLLDSRKHDDPLADAEPDVVEGQEGLDHPILIPGYDLLNHRPLTPVSWISTPASSATGAEGRVSLVHHFPLGPNQQIFNNYGSKPSSSLLLSYGFALPLDKQPEGMETLPLLLGGIPPAKQALCDRVGVPWSKAWDLCLIDGVVEPPTGLRKLLRVVVADPDEEAEIAADAGRLAGRISGDNELSALDALSELLQGKLAVLERVATAEPPAGVRPDVVQVAEVYRTNQITLLTEAAAWTGREMTGVARELGLDLDADDGAFDEEG
jgi:hypothetical protein